MSGFTILDSDILIDALRNIGEALSHIRRLEQHTTVAISAVSEMELIIGCRNKTELHVVEKFLSRFLTLVIVEQISNTAVDLLKQYRLSHGLLMADALIAATALFYVAPLSSKNQKDFRFIANLNLLAYP